jgi:hypothetical protein
LGLDISNFYDTLLQQATKEGDKSIVNASFHVTHWSVAPFGTGLSRVKNVSCVFGGDVLRLEPIL